MNKNETYQQTAWRLSDLFTGFDDPNIAKTYQLLEEMVSKFEEYRDSLTPGIDTSLFMDIVKGMEAIQKLGTRIGGFAELAFAADTQDQKAQIAIAQFEQFAAEMSNRTLFFNLRSEERRVGKTCKSRWSHPQ